MSLSWVIARRLAAVAVIGAAIALLPVNTDLSPLTIPDVLWLPLVSILELGRYFPIATMLAIFAAGLAIQAALASMWLVTWLWGKVVG